MQNSGLFLEHDLGRFTDFTDHGGVFPKAERRQPNVATPSIAMRMVVVVVVVVPTLTHLAPIQCSPWSQDRCVWHV